MNRNAKDNQKEKRRLTAGRRLLFVSCVLCAASLIIMFLALRIHREPDFVPPPFDDAAVAGTPDVPADLAWQELDAQAYRFSICGVFAPKDGTADIWLTDPQDSGVWMKLRVLDADGNMLGETGLIRPGEYVQSVALSPQPAVGDTVTLKLMAYQPDTYYSAGAVSLEAPVS